MAGNKNQGPPAQYGRDDIAAQLASLTFLPMEDVRKMILALFGSGGSGPGGGTRTTGLIERIVEAGSEVNIRGFGRFLRVDYKESTKKFRGARVTCRAKSKIAFRPSRSTDIFK